MSPWAESKDTVKPYSRQLKYRFKMYEKSLCITDGNQLAPTSRVYCDRCLALHLERSKRWKRKRKDQASPSS